MSKTGMFILVVIVVLAVSAVSVAANEVAVSAGQVYTFTDKLDTGYQVFVQTKVGSVPVGALYIGGLDRSETHWGGHLTLESHAQAAALGAGIKGSYKSLKLDLFAGIGEVWTKEKATSECDERKKTFTDNNSSLRPWVRPSITYAFNDRLSTGINANFLGVKDVNNWGWEIKYSAPIGK